MIKAAANAELYVDYYNKIEPDVVRDAYRYLIGLLSTLEQYECEPKKGKTSFKILRAGTSNNEPFSFIVNKNMGILFYFLEPVTRPSLLKLNDIRKVFPEPDPNNIRTQDDEEWTIRLSSIDDVKKLEALSPSPFDTGLFE